MPRQAAIVWDYFQVTNKDLKQATCNFCQRSLSYKSTTANLKLHLRHKHVGVYEELRNTESLNAAKSTRNGKYSI